jgi:hypothetical protein
LPRVGNASSLEWAFLVNPSLSLFPTMSEFFRPCRNVSDHVADHVGMFPTMSEFFRPYPISKEEFFPCRNFFPIPILYAVINSLLVDGRDPGLSHGKKPPEGGSKNIHRTAEGIIRLM